MSRQTIMEESRLVALTDEQLLELVGALWESVKRIDEAMKADLEIERLLTHLKEYKDDNYLDSKRSYMSKLKAARALAKVRGLRFNLPERTSDED